MLRLRLIAEGTPEAPLLLLYGRDQETFAQIIGCMRRLAAEEAVLTRMTEITGVVSVDGTDVTLMLGHSDEGATCSGEGDFRWVLTGRSWDDVAELLLPFIEEDEGRTRHQRLSSQAHLLASSLPVIVTTSLDGEW
jgi:hypothetical protein